MRIKPGLLDQGKPGFNPMIYLGCIKTSKNVSPKPQHDKRANSEDPDAVAHSEPPHSDLRYLEIQAISFLGGFNS